MKINHRNEDIWKTFSKYQALMTALIMTGNKGKLDLILAINTWAGKCVEKISRWLFIKDLQEYSFIHLILSLGTKVFYLLRGDMGRNSIWYIKIPHTRKSMSCSVIYLSLNSFMEIYNLCISCAHTLILSLQCYLWTLLSEKN